MSDAAQTYTPPDTASTTALPAQVAGYLDGAAGDVVIIPNLAENLLDPAGEPNGMAHKMIIDATTPKAPDRRGDYGEVLDTPEQTDA